MDDDAALVESPLVDRHEAFGAKFAPFAGWRMPLEYTGTGSEHAAVRAAVGIFDVSHLGTLDVHGPQAEQVVARAFTNDPTRLADGESQYTLCLTEDGGIVDDLIVYRLGDHFRIVPNASNTQAVVDVLREGGFDATISDVSTGVAILAIQGPASDHVVAAAVGRDLADLPRLFTRSLGEDGQTVVARTGYTGERGVEVMCPTDRAGQIWDAAIAAGALPCGLGARDTLRLEMGYPLHGNDISRETTPTDARLNWAVVLGRGFRGEAAATAARAAGPTRRLLGVVGEGRRPLRAGMAVLRAGASVGSLTSGSVSPGLGVGIGLGYFAPDVAEGDSVEVDVRGRTVAARVVRPPFVQTSL